MFLEMNAGRRRCASADVNSGRRTGSNRNNPNPPAYFRVSRFFLFCGAYSNADLETSVCVGEVSMNRVKQANKG